MTTKAEFLERVAARIGTGLPTNPARPVEPVANDPIEYAIDLSDPLAAFRNATSALGVTVVDTDLDGLADVVRGVMPADGRIAFGDHPDLVGVRDQLAADFTIEEDHAPASLSGCAVGVTTVRAAVALTGSIVIDSSVGGARVVSLLPDLHLAVVRRDQIVPTPGDVLRPLGRPDHPLPSNLFFVSGPSRSADIELQLTVGVHGPKEMMIALV